MPIKASAARQIGALIADLSSDRAAVREAAIARLAVVGPRAVDRLIGALAGPAPDVRIAALRALESIADVRALEPILEQVGDHAGKDTSAANRKVAVAAVSAARVFLAGERGALVVDRLTAVVLDRSVDDEVRIAALQALGDLGPATIAPLLAAIESEPSEALRKAAAFDDTVDPASLITLAAERELPDDPDELWDALAKAGTVPMPVLLRVVERVREREARESEAGRQRWMRVRGRAHLTLAEASSRLGIYDLRESFERAVTPLPVEFLAAIQTAGDASCLEALAAAYARSAPAESAGGGAPWWRDRLRDAFVIIARREQLTRRHSIMRKIAKRFGAALDDLWSVGFREPRLGDGRQITPHAGAGGSGR